MNKFTLTLCALALACLAVPAVKADIAGEINEMESEIRSRLPSTPKMNMPSMPNMPKMNMPSMPNMPKMNMPSMPDMHMPDMHMPDMHMPSMPDMSMPDMHMPSMPSMPTTSGVMSRIRRMIAHYMGMPDVPTSVPKLKKPKL